MSALIVEVRTAPIPTLVTVAGEIDILTAPELRDQVHTVPDGDIILDLSGVRLLAAAGLRVLLELRDHRARAGMQVVLAAPSPSVQRVLVVTELDHALPMTATVDDAVALITAALSRGARRIRGMPPTDCALHPRFPAAASGGCGTSVETPEPRAPRANAIAERFVGTSAANSSTGS